MCIAPCHNLSLQTPRLEIMFVFRSFHGGDRTGASPMLACEEFLLMLLVLTL